MKQTPMTLRYAEVGGKLAMTGIQTVVAVANLIVAFGTIGSAMVSWWRGGVVAEFIDNIGRIETIEKDVDEINNWKNNTDTLLVALALGNENVDDRKAMEKVGVKTDYKDLLQEKWKREEEEARGGD